MRWQNHAVTQRDGGKYRNQTANGLPTMKCHELTVLENAAFGSEYDIRKDTDKLETL